ncbi:hypothetical protein K438DRAFT_1962069 [Mycena galopus ATCC 62051]|nr:hypothetical protein K438DRAFT_1962069 [Mycena galopus ATCC 62051]
MATLVTKAGMDWDDTFKPYNLTQLYADVEGVRDIVSQHLIPTPLSKVDTADTIINNNQPLPLDDSATYGTLRSPSTAYGDVIFRKTETNDYIVGIKGAWGTKGDAPEPRATAEPASACCIARPSWTRSSIDGCEQALDGALIAAIEQFSNDLN